MPNVREGPPPRANSVSSVPSVAMPTLLPPGVLRPNPTPPLGVANPGAAEEGAPVIDEVG